MQWYVGLDAHSKNSVFVIQDGEGLRVGHGQVPTNPAGFQKRAFDQGRGEPVARVRQIAKKYGVQPSAVRTALKRFWGPERYQKKLPIKRNPEALLALMNDPKIQKSEDVLSTAAQRLGIKKRSLMSILSRKGIRRNGSRYVWMPGRQKEVSR